MVKIWVPQLTFEGRLERNHGSGGDQDGAEHSCRPAPLPRSVFADLESKLDWFCMILGLESHNKTVCVGRHHFACFRYCFVLDFPHVLKRKWRRFERLQVWCWHIFVKDTSQFLMLCTNRFQISLGLELVNTSWCNRWSPWRCLSLASGEVWRGVLGVSTHLSNSFENRSYVFFDFDMSLNELGCTLGFLFLIHSYGRTSPLLTSFFLRTVFWRRRGVFQASISSRFGCRQMVLELVHCTSPIFGGYLGTFQVVDIRPSDSVQTTNDCSAVVTFGSWSGFFRCPSV